MSTPTPPGSSSNDFNASIRQSMSTLHGTNYQVDDVKVGSDGIARMKVSHKGRQYDVSIGSDLVTGVVNEAGTFENSASIARALGAHILSMAQDQQITTITSDMKSGAITYNGKRIEYTADAGAKAAEYDQKTKETTAQFERLNEQLTSFEEQLAALRTQWFKDNERHLIQTKIDAIKSEMRPIEKRLKELKFDYSTHAAAAIFWDLMRPTTKIVVTPSSSATLPSQSLTVAAQASKHPNSSVTGSDETDQPTS